MTLDTLTRAQAEVSHVRLKNSLVQTSQTFREHFQSEQELFRTIRDDIPTSTQPQSPSRLKNPNKSTPTAAPVLSSLDEDIVRMERLNQCCKRVRVWRRQVTNPLLQYKQQQHQLASGKSALGSVSTGVGVSKKPDRRMHVTLLMAMVVDMYEQRVFSELEGAGLDGTAEGATTGSTPGSSTLQESFPEFVVRFVSQRASNRRQAVDQLHSTVATVLYSAATQSRVRLFGSLCGVDDKFNPPEKIKMFVHLLENLYRCKVAASVGATGAKTARIDEVCASVPLADVVFHNVGIAQHVAREMIGDLFRDNYYWNFRFWCGPCSELKVDCAWPSGVCDELQERALTLAAASRNVLLNAHRKIDGDAFLELLIEAWTARAKQLYAQLEAATDTEERLAAELLRSRQTTQNSRMQYRPITESERQLFEQLVDEYWNAQVPWSSAKVQARVAALTPHRPLSQLQQLYAKYVSELPSSQRKWEWLNWHWETEWQWGSLELE